MHIQSREISTSHLNTSSTHTVKRTTYKSPTYKSPLHQQHTYSEENYIQVTCTQAMHIPDVQVCWRSGVRRNSTPPCSDAPPDSTQSLWKRKSSMLLKILPRSHCYTQKADKKETEDNEQNNSSK